MVCLHVYQKVTRERNVLQFLQELATFSKTPQFIFQPAPHDKVSLDDCVCAPPVVICSLQSDFIVKKLHWVCACVCACGQVCTLQEVCGSKSEEECLLSEAKKWTTKAAKDYKMICNGQRVSQNSPQDVSSNNVFFKKRQSAKCSFFQYGCGTHKQVFKMNKSFSSYCCYRLILCIYVVLLMCVVFLPGAPDIRKPPEALVRRHRSQYGAED